jgi:tetratricopeptide (TPR) repeat protein
MLFRSKKAVIDPYLCAAALFAIAVLSSNCVYAQSTNFQEQYEEAQRALGEGRYAEAERAYEKFRETNPNVAEIRANLGLIYFEEKKFQQAVPELRQALRLKPSLSKSAALLAMSLSELGQYAEAIPGLEKGFRSSDIQIQRMCGLQLERAYSALKNDNKAVEVALKLNGLYPNDPEVLYHNGKIFGNFAFLSMQKLSQVAPESVWTHLTAAEAYESQSSYNSAITEYRQVLAIQPRRPGIHYRLGRTLLARGRATNSAEDLNAAIAEFEEELKLDPLNASAAYEIGEVHRNAGEFLDAERYFELALKNYPDFEEAHLGLAAILSHAGKPQLALPHLQKAVSLNPENEVTWYRLSRVEGSLGNMDEAQTALAKFRKLHQRKTPQEQASKPLFSAQDVTKQTLDPDAAQ